MYATGATLSMRTSTAEVPMILRTNLYARNILQQFFVPNQAQQKNPPPPPPKLQHSSLRLISVGVESEHSLAAYISMYFPTAF